MTAGQRNEEKAYPVSRVNRYLKNLFLSDYLLSHILVSGEVSNCKYHTSGHIYFTLKDETSQMACVMFAGQRGGLDFQLEEGLSVIVTGSIQVYERDGRYQLYATRIKREGTGALYERFIELKTRLEEEGLFAPEYKKPIPAYAKTVGIVTAKTGAAVRDIIHISRRRNPYIELIVCPAKVQGEGAAASIVRGIRKLDALGPDVIIVGRGGGSIEELWAFNEESVARAVFECETPVISAVGHETDTTLTDYAADLRAPTPSAAAELAVCDIREFYAALAGASRSLGRAMEQRLSLYRNRLENDKLRLTHESPASRLTQRRQFLMDGEEALKRAMEGRLADARHRLALYIERMKGLSPLDRLKNGYMYASFPDGRRIRSASEVKKGDKIRLAAADGEIRAAVEEVLPALGPAKKEKEN